MILVDVNLLIYAHRRDCENHEKYRSWLKHALSQEPVFGISELILSSTIRILTHPKVFAKPDSLKEAFDYVDTIKSRKSSVVIVPGERHWGIFIDLCEKVDARGNLITDAYLAALSIEHGARFITTDRDYARFPGLKWKHPLE